LPEILLSYRVALFFSPAVFPAVNLLHTIESLIHFLWDAGNSMLELGPAPLAFCPPKSPRAAYWHSILFGHQKRCPSHRLGPVLETDRFSGYRMKESGIFADGFHFLEYVPRRRKPVTLSEQSA
jgi:hypothetical protein